MPKIPVNVIFFDHSGMPHSGSVMYHCGVSQHLAQQIGVKIGYSTKWIADAYNIRALNKFIWIQSYQNDLVNSILDSQQFFLLAFFIIWQKIFRFYLEKQEYFLMLFTDFCKSGNFKMLHSAVIVEHKSVLATHW